MKSVYSAVRTGSLNTAVCASYLEGLITNRETENYFGSVGFGNVCCISKRFTSFEIINCRIITETTIRKQVLLPSSGTETNLMVGLFRYSFLVPSQDSVQGCVGQTDGCLVTERGKVPECKLNMGLLGPA